MLSFMVVFSSWVFWVQVRGVGSDSNCLSNNSDASVGKGISHVVASVPSGSSTRNRLMYPQKGNITTLQNLFVCFVLKPSILHVFSFIHVFLKCMFLCFSSALKLVTDLINSSVF